MARTPEQIKQALRQNGVTYKQWAEERGFYAEERGFYVGTVKKVIYGDLQGLRGVSHEIAVKLGLKEEPKEELG
ncbi:MAG: DNA-binding protein [Magnetococcales bacterium]|nr:DNA-binding protein [Magnetococcales bacterium]